MITNSKGRGRIIDQLREIANDLSGLPLESLEAEVSFLELGFDSLFLTQLSAAYQKAFRVRITFRQLFDDLSTLSALGAYIEAQLPAEEPAEVEPAAVASTVTNASVAPPVSMNHTSEPAVPPRTAAPPPPPVAVRPRRLDAPRAAGLEAVLLQQLDLMTEQLNLLRGVPSDRGEQFPVEAAPSEVQASEQPPAPAPVPAAEVKVQETAPVKSLSGFGPSDSKNTGLHAITPRQQRHLDTLIERYTRKTAGSKQRTQKFRRVLADPRTAAGFNRRWKEMVYPIWVERSLGSKLWDVDGNEYIDLLNGFGPNFLGHSPDYITAAIEDQLHRGFEIGPQTMLAGEVAEMICQLTGMDRVSFTCSGSEAVQAAMRLSRTVTARDKIVLFSKDYHGNFDQVLVRDANQPSRLRTLPSAPGIPLQSVDDTYVLEYGSPESLEIIRKHADEIAAVMVEPVQSRRPEFQPREFLHELRRITREAGIILVFDEVVNGFRVGPGGAQAYFGVEADLATYGKIVGGGMPIGVVAGRSAVMDTFDGGHWQYGDDSFPGAGVTFFAGTFVRHPLAMAAAHATLKHLIREGPALQERVASRASKLARRVNEVFQKYELNIEMPQFSSQMYLRIKEQGELANLLYFHLRYRGVHVLEGFPSYMTDAHNEDDLAHLVRAFTESVETMVEDGIFGNPARLSAADGREFALEPTSLGLNGTPDAVSPAIPSVPAKHAPSDAQRDMWVAAQMSNEASAASYGSNVVELVGDFQAPLLERAIASVVARHEALRSTFAPGGTEVVVHASMPIELRVHDLSTVGLAERDSLVARILDEEVRQVFDLTTGPLVSFQLMKLSSNHHLLSFTAHMIVCDGWGFKVVLEEISAFYSAYLEGRDPSLDPVRQMREYVAWQKTDYGSECAKECDRFWLSQFDTLPPPFELPATDVRPPTRSYEAGRESIRLTPEFCRTLKRVARELRNTPFALLLTAFEIWLHRLSGMDDFVVGVPFAGQGALGLNTLVGQCVHTLPFRARVDSSAPFADHLTKTRSLVLDAQEKWTSNIGSLVQKLSLPSDPSRLPLASVMFNLDPPFSGVHFAGCVSRITSGPRYTYHYDLGLNVVDEGDTFLVECDYNKNLFEGGVVRCWVDSLHSILDGVVADPKTPVGRLPMLKDAEVRQRSETPARSVPELPAGTTIQEMVSAQAARTPDATALETDHGQFRFAELDQRANQIANYLRAHEVPRGGDVVVHFDHGYDLVPALLGVLKAGCAFSLLDATSPRDPAHPAIVLTNTRLSGLLPQGPGVRILCLDKDAKSVHDQATTLPACLSGSNETACVAYSDSGGPARLAAVRIPHGAVVDCLSTIAERAGIGPGDSMLAANPDSCDAAIGSILVPLALGARIVMVSSDLLQTPVEFDNAIERNRATWVGAGAPDWRRLVNAGWKGNPQRKALACGGLLTQRVRERLPVGCLEMWSLYRPVESPVWVSLRKLETNESLPLLTPMAHARAEVRDDRGEFVPAGVPGQVLAGADAAPLQPTGVIGRYRADGQIEIVGGQSRQIILRGHRINLDKLEAILSSHPDVNEVAVVLREQTSQEPHLVAYVRPEGPADDGAQLSASLRKFARKKVPAYMVPSAFVVVPEFPRHPGDEVDRSALPAPSPAQLDYGKEEYTAPRNQTEERLARLWSETLHVDRVSVADNFFTLGGQSLLAVALFAKIEKEFGKKLPLAILFTSPTVEDLAEALEKKDTAGPWPSLLPIQPKGDKPTLFLVHGAGGNVLLYRTLGEHFSPDYPLYGLQSQGLDGRSAALLTIEEMAAFYLKEVREVQPRGPYYLGGYCLGGTVAYEMAQILRKQGEEVALVAMLDTYNFSRALKVKFHSFLYQKIKFHAANFARLRPAEMLSYLTEKIRQLREGEWSNLKTSMPGASPEIGVSRATCGTEASIQALNDFAAESYVPRPYPGEIVLFKPRFNYKFYPDPQMGWGDLAASIDTVEVAVNPHAMLLEPYVVALAQQLKDRIDTASSSRTVMTKAELEYEDCTVADIPRM